MRLNNSARLCCNIVYSDFRYILVSLKPLKITEETERKKLADNILIARNILIKVILPHHTTKCLIISQF